MISSQFCNTWNAAFKQKFPIGPISDSREGVTEQRIKYIQRRSSSRKTLFIFITGFLQYPSAGASPYNISSDCQHSYSECYIIHLFNISISLLRQHYSPPTCAMLNQYSRSQVSPIIRGKKDATFTLRHIVTECDMILPIFLDF